MLIRPPYRVDIAVNLYIDEKISLGKSAEIAGVSLEEMKDILRLRGVEIKIGCETIQEAREEVEVLRGI